MSEVVKDVYWNYLTQEVVESFTLICPRCLEAFSVDPKKAFDEVFYNGELGALCKKCCDEWGYDFVIGPTEDKPEPPKLAPTPPGVKRECATCAGVFDVPIDTPCATCYGHTNWRPGAKQ